MLEKLLGLLSPPKSAAEWRTAAAAASAKRADTRKRLEEEQARRRALLIEGSDAQLDAQDQELRQLERADARLEIAQAEAERQAAEAAQAEERARLDRLAAEAVEAQARGLALVQGISARWGETVADFRELRAAKALVKKANFELKAAGRESIKDPEAIAGAAGRAWTSVLDTTLFDPIARRTVWPPAGFNPAAQAVKDQREAADQAAAALAAAG